MWLLDGPRQTDFRGSLRWCAVLKVRRRLLLHRIFCSRGRLQRTIYQNGRPSQKHLAATSSALHGTLESRSRLPPQDCDCAGDGDGESCHNFDIARAAKLSAVRGCSQCADVNALLVRRTACQSLTSSLGVAFWSWDNVSGELVPSAC